jgi:hypothetical protein
MPPVGPRWVSNFIKRQPELKTRFFRRYDYQRAKCEDPVAINAWFSLIENIIAKHGIRSDDIYNFDETGFMMGVIMSGMVVTGTERRANPKRVQPGNREWVTAIESINAEGWALPPFIIVAGQYHLSSWYRDSNLPADWAIATTKNDWTDNKTGLEWLKHFNRHTINRSNGTYRLLILDGHESHHSVAFEDLIKCSITHVSKTEFLPAFYAAHQATITKSNIQGGFKGAGLAPLDANHVISKLDIQLRSLTPAIDEPELPAPWTSRTPKTVKETESRSEYLRRRIERHHSSSPASIIEALKSMTKGR